MGAWEGGANAILARGALRSRQGAREMALRGPPERRMVTLARLDPGLVVANIHASGPSPLAAEDTRMAAEATVGWAGDDPLVLGGDFNVTPSESGVFDELARRFGLERPTGAHTIDHLLARGLQIIEPPTEWPAEAREVPAGDRAIRLSDHAPIQARYAWPTSDDAHA
jgi:endonuclease/exonuclease/phosphatase family metal-dependent hydrolase